MTSNPTSCQTNKKSKLDPESDVFDVCYSSDCEVEDFELDEITANFEQMQFVSALEGNVAFTGGEISTPHTCSINSVEAERALSSYYDACQYLKQNKISLNSAEIERVQQNKTVGKRKCRENRHKECVTADVVEESNQPFDPNRELSPYEMMRKAIAENMKDLKSSIRELTEDGFQQWSGVQKTSDETIDLSKRAARKRSYVPCFGGTKATFVEQIVYLTKLKGIVELMRNNEESPQVVNDDDGADYEIKLTVTEAVQIPPNSQQQIGIQPVDEAEVNNELYLFHSSHAARFTLQDGTFINKMGKGTVANYSKKILHLKPGHIVGYAKKAEFINLPTLEDIFDITDLVVNAMETVKNEDDIVESESDIEESDPKSAKFSNPVKPFEITSSPSERVDQSEKIKSNGPVARECIRRLKLKLTHCGTAFTKMVLSHKSVFLTEEDGEQVRFIKCDPIDLPLRDNLPDFLPLPYKRGFNRDEQIAVDQWLKQNVMSGLITKVPHAKVLSPVLIVRKLDEDGKQKTRFLLDARQINAKILSPVSIPFPDINEGLKNLSKMSHHTSMDVKSAFHRVPISEKSKTYTAFVVGAGGMVGTYVFNSLVQGALSSPAIFCSVMQEMLRELHGDVQTYCFVDDNLTSSPTELQHEIDVDKVLTLFERNWVVIDVKKSEFNQTTVLWCGYQIGEGKYGPDPERLGKLDDLLKSIPSCKFSQLKRWQMTFGLTNYYRKFVPQYSRIEAGIRERIELVKEDKLGFREADLINYGEFKIIVEAIKAAALVISDRTQPLRIRTDASITALGFVVETMNKEPVMFGGRKLTRSEKNLSMFELELIGVLYAIEKTQDLILNAPRVIIESDNLAGLKNLTGKSSHVVSCGALRTILAIQTRCAPGKVRYAHIKGCLNYVSDYLSRCEDKIGNTSTVDPAQISKLVINAMTSTRRTRAQAEEARVVEEIRQMHQCTHDGVGKTILTCEDRGLKVKNLRKVVQEIIYNCVGCNRERKVLFDSILAFSPTPSYPYETISVDHTFMTRSLSGNDNCLTVVDEFSKFFTAMAGNNHKIGPFLGVIQSIHQNFPLLRVIKADNAFNSKELKDWCANQGIELRLNCSHNSRANSVERYNGILKDKLEKFLHAAGEPVERWDAHLAAAVGAMNSSVHAVTKFAPHEVVYGERAPLFRDFARDDVYHSQGYVEKIETIGERLREECPDFAEKCALIKKRIEQQKSKYSMVPKDIPVLEVGEKVYIKYHHKDPLISAEVVQDDGLSCVLRKTAKNQINQHRQLRVHKRHIWRRKSTVLNAFALDSVYNQSLCFQGGGKGKLKRYPTQQLDQYERWGTGEEKYMDWEPEPLEVNFCVTPRIWE